MHALEDADTLEIGVAFFSEVNAWKPVDLLVFIARLPPMSNIDRLIEFNRFF